jgi:hypothetical protein
MVQLRIIHAAFSAPPVDVYAVPLPVGVTHVKPLASNISFGTVLPASGKSAVQVPAGSYTLYLTLAGTKQVVYESASVTIAKGDNFLLVAVGVAAGQDQGHGNHAGFVQLLVVDNKRGGSKFLPDHGA